MSATAPTLPVDPDEGGYCGPWPAHPDRGFFWIPLAVFAAFVAVGIALWWVLPAAGWTAAPPGSWPIFPFGFVVVAIFLVLVVRGFGWGWYGGWRGRGWGGAPSAREVVRRRYASGEITRDQYRELLRDLEQGP
jgi:uncharacterized membrane protein